MNDNANGAGTTDNDSGAGAGAGDDILGAGGEGQGAEGQGQGAGGEGSGTGAEGGAQGGDKGGEGAEGKKDGEGSGDDKGGAPESYEFTMPEGMEPDQPLLDAVSEIFKAKNLSQEDAQEIVDSYNKVLQERAKESENETNEVLQQWAKEIRDDKEFGGDKYDETVKLARLAVNELGGEQAQELRDLFTRTGLGVHPVLVKVMARAGKLLSEDGSLSAGGEGGSQTPREKRLFPNS